MTRVLLLDDDSERASVIARAIASLYAVGFVRSQAECLACLETTRTG